MDNEPMYRCTICGQEGSVGRCCGDDTRIPLNEAAEKEMHDIRMLQVVHMSRSTLWQMLDTARAEALREAASKCDMQHFMDIVLNWAQDTGAAKKLSLYHMNALAERLVSITEHTILADTKEDGKNG